jgi:hypothetical protein
MKRLLIGLALGVMATAANAQWTPVAETNDRSQTSYVDFRTFTRTGDTVKVWFLTDYAKATPTNPILSSKSLHEYRCKEKTFRVLSLTHYTGKLGTGDIFSTENKSLDKWDYVVPGSIGAVNMEGVCSYKP